MAKLLEIIIFCLIYGLSFVNMVTVSLFLYIVITNNNIRFFIGNNEIESVFCVILFFIICLCFAIFQHFRLNVSSINLSMLVFICTGLIFLFFNIISIFHWLDITQEGSLLTFKVLSIVKQATVEIKKEHLLQNLNQCILLKIK